MENLPDDTLVLQHDYSTGLYDPIDSAHLQIRTARKHRKLNGYIDVFFAESRGENATGPKRRVVLIG